jgi:hypothetical protein
MKVSFTFFLLAATIYCQGKLPNCGSVSQGTECTSAGDFSAVTFQESRKRCVAAFNACQSKGFQDCASKRDACNQKVSNGDRSPALAAETFGRHVYAVTDVGSTVFTPRGKPKTVIKKKKPLGGVRSSGRPPQLAPPAQVVKPVVQRPKDTPPFTNPQKPKNPPPAPPQSQSNGDGVFCAKWTRTGGPEGVTVDLSNTPVTENVKIEGYKCEKWLYPNDQFEKV